MTTKPAGQRTLNREGMGFPIESTDAIAFGSSARRIWMSTWRMYLQRLDRGLQRRLSSRLVDEQRPLLRLAERASVRCAGAGCCDGVGTRRDPPSGQVSLDDRSPAMRPARRTATRP